MCDGARASFLVQRDSAARQGTARPMVGAARARKDAKYRWCPSEDDPDCQALRKGRDTLPSSEVLQRSFCNRREGTTILIVGDSLQWELFLAFTNLFGAVPRAMCEAECDPPIDVCNWRNTAKRPAVVESVLCSQGTADSFTTVRFIGDSFLAGLGHEGVLGSSVQPSGRGQEHEQDLLTNHTACRWAPQVVEADLIVLNLGVHPGLTVETHGRMLTAVLSKIAAMRSTAGLSPPSQSVVFRGSHAATANCFELHDPLPAHGHDLAEYIRNVTRFAVGEFENHEWELFEPKNRAARRVTQLYGVPYFDTYFATSLRPGGRRPAFHDCLHYCLPGPPDDWARLLLALWT